MPRTCPWEATSLVKQNRGWEDQSSLDKFRGQKSSLISQVKQAISQVKQLRGYILQSSLSILSQQEIYLITSITTDKAINSFTRVTTEHIEEEDIDFLVEIPPTELSRLAKWANLSKDDVVQEAAAAFEWLQANGETRSNYRIYLQSWIRKGAIQKWGSFKADDNYDFEN